MSSGNNPLNAVISQVKSKAVKQKPDLHHYTGVLDYLSGVLASILA